MNKLFFLVFFSLSISLSSQIKYPLSKKEIVVDTFFNITVDDPYRWMEDDKSKNVNEWINKLSNKLPPLIFICMKTLGISRYAKVVVGN